MHGESVEAMSVQDKALLRAMSEDRALASAMLFAHRHPDPSPDFHVQILDLWRSRDELVLIEAFRESAKTTLSEEFLALEGAFGNFFYAVIFCETYAKSTQRIEAIAWEAKTNAKLAKLFSGKVLSKKPIENKIWFSSGALIECAGWEQEITGFKHLGNRPDRAYLDDVENLERVRSSAAVDQTMEKLYREVLPALDKRRRRVRVTQTPRAGDCMVTRLRANPDWITASFPICSGDIDDPATVSAWPQRYPMAWIRAERDKYERMGQLKSFNQEYLLRVDTEDTKPFTEEMLRFTDVAPAAWLARKVIYDPARTPNVATSAMTGKVVVSRRGSQLIVHESDGQFWKPDETREDVFRMWERHGAPEIGIEKDSLDEYLLQPLRYEMLRRGIALSIRELRAPQDRDKGAFIMGLQPFFKAGDVVLVGGRSAHAKLISQVMNFPQGRVDILNALAYALRMFSGDLVYEDFGEANVAPAPEPKAAEKVLACWNASPSDTVLALVLRRGRSVFVLADYAAPGPHTDAIRACFTDARGAFPRATFEHWAPAELHDQWQRVGLVPALQAERLRPLRADLASQARGALLEPMRTVIRGARLLTVDARAPRTLAALSCDYKYDLGRDGARNREPVPGIPRLIAEALETALAPALRAAAPVDAGAHYGYNPQGVRYMTALPTRR